MPVRSLRSSVLRWPDADSVRGAAEAWARDLLATNPRVRRAGYFGSYAKGNAGVGSDLDLVVVVDETSEPVVRRGIAFETHRLPVPVDLLVYTEEELAALLASGTRFAGELRDHAVWFER